MGEIMLFIGKPMGRSIMISKGGHGMIPPPPGFSGHGMIPTPGFGGHGMIPPPPGFFPS